MKEKLLLTLALWLALVVSTWAQNNALHFDGSNDYVTCPAINPTNFTLEAWVYPTQLNRDQPVLSTLSEITNRGMELHIADDNLPLITIRNGSSWLDVKATSTVSKDTWVHLAATYNGSTVTLYVNGVEAKTASATAYNPGSKALYIGKRTEGNASNFAGKIDEVRVWSTARTQAEIIAGMPSGFIGTETNLALYYKFNQGTILADNSTVTSLTDATTNAKHGTLTNFTLTGTTSNWVEGYTTNHVIYSLTALPSQVSIERASSSTATFAITTNSTWSIVDADDWLDLDVTSGTGNGTITLTANETNTTDATRSIQLVITGTNAANDTVTVTQQRGTISVSASSASINSSVGSTTTFDITSNTDWSIAESNDWFSVSPVSGSGNATITVTADLLNNNSNPRSASLTISGTNATDTTVTITQGPATIALSRTAVDIDAPANSHAYFFVTTDVDWQTTCSASWLTLNKTSGTGNDTISITAEALPEGVDERSANIIFTGLFNPAGVVVTQKALPNNALHFDGSNDYVVCKPVAPSQFTAESWVYLDNVSDHKAIISNANENSYYKNFRFEIEYNKLSLYMGYGSNWNTLVSNTTIEANKWYHVAASFDGSVAKFYINGVQDAYTKTISSFTTAEDIPLYIGAYYLSTTCYPFKGKMDDVRLWSHARSAEEIMSDLNNQTTDNTGLLVWYNFNQGITNGNNAGITTLYDASSNLNDGTLTNFALNGTTSNWVEGTPGKFLLANTSTTGLTAEAGSTTVTISSNTNWELINNTNWLTPNITEGNGNTTVTLAYSANNNHNERSNTVAFATQGLDTVFITFTQQPGKVLSAIFSADNTNSSVKPATVTFTDASTATNTTITSWEWDFGDGSTSTDQNPVHTYTDFGSYTVTLIVYDGTFSDTLINAGYINVSNDILMHGGEVTISDSVYFYDSGGANNQYVNSENYTLVFQPSIPGASIKLDFISFSSENHCDYLNIYNGANISADLLAKQTGTTYTTPLLANNTNGVLCAYFHSDGSSLRDGWKALVTQVLPNAAFTVLDTLVWVDSEVAFTDASTLAGLNAWSWDFGDGATSTEQNPTHTYTTTGIYTVTLTASNGTVSKSTTKTIQVVNAPIARFTADITTGFQPTVQFTNTSVGATSYEWNFGDGSDAVTDNNPSHTFYTAGTYTVTLTAFDAVGNNTTTMEIVANGITANFGSNITSGYQPAVQFADSTIGATSWSWNFGDGSELSTGQNPVHTYTTAGTYDVTLTVSDGYNTNTLTRKNYITSDPLYCNFNANNTQGYLQTVTFTDASQGNITSWAWDFGDGTTSTEQNPVHTYTTAGVYAVSFTVSDGIHSSTAVKQNYITTDRILMSNQNITIADGDAISFYDSGNNTGMYSNSERYTLVLYPSETGKAVQIDFISFISEHGFDYLKIYDGPSTSDYLLATQNGSTYTSTVTATNASGALCLYFYSDGGDIRDGWEALITQIDRQLVLTWPAPADITYGTALNSDILNATANMPGTFTYNYPIGTMFNAGTHTLTATFTPENTNYPVTSKSVTITVKKAELLATADNATMEVGGVIPKLTITYVGFVNGDDVSNLNLTPVAATNATSTSSIGEYTIQCLSGFDTNYNINFQSGILTIEPYTWTGTTNEIWSTASNWFSNKVPSNVISVKIKSNAPHQPVLSSDAVCADLTIETGAVVTIASDATLSVTGQLVNNNGVDGLILISDATGTGKLVNNTPSVPATVQQYIVQDQWHYFGLPIEGSHNANNLLHNFYVVKSNEDRPMSNPWEYLTAQDNLTRGQGYGAFYSRKTNNDTTLVFKGLLNTGTITVETSNSGDDLGWNFVSNPYPCTLDWNVVKNNLTEIEDAVYVWNPTLNDNNKYGRYGTYVDGVQVNAQTQYIAPMQGFFVKAKAGNGGVSFTNAAKSTQPSTFKSAELNALIRLNASDTNGYDDETVVRFKTGSTHEFDSRYDARKLNALSSLNPQIYSVLNGDEYSINSIPEATVNTVIPFELLVKSTGTQQIAATELTGLDATLDVVLEDLQTGARTLLANSAYRFSATAGETRKFNLLFADATNVTRVEARTIKAYGAENRMCISNMSDGRNIVAVYNLNGQLVHQTNAEGSYTEVELPNGLYVVKVTPENGNVFNGKVRIGSFK